MASGDAANLGPRGRRRRRALGLVAAGLGAVVAAALVAGGAPPLALVGVAPLVWLGALGLLQAQAGT